MNFKLLKQKALISTVISIMAVIVAYNSMLAARRGEKDYDEAARRARIAACITASGSLALDDTARYAGMIMAMNVRATAERPDEKQWAAFEILTSSTDKGLQNAMALDLVEALKEEPVAPARYYSTVVSGLPPQLQYEVIKRWVDNNPTVTMANAMWAYVRAYIAENAGDPLVAETFGDYIAGRDSVQMAEEILASVDSLRTRIGVHPAIEQVAFRMYRLKGDSVSIEQRASELAGSYSTDPVIGPVLLEAYSAIGKEDDANRLRIDIFEANPSGEMISRLFRSLTTRADSISLVRAVARSVRRPDIDIENKIDLVVSAADELFVGRPNDDEHSKFILSLADSIYEASAGVASEFADDWDAVRGLANVGNRPWVQYQSHPMLLDYARSHPDSLQINAWIVGRILETDSVADLEPLILNLARRAPDNINYRLLYPVWLNNMGQLDKAAREYDKFDIDDIRQAVRTSLELSGSREIADGDTASFEEMVGDVWFTTKSFHSQTLYGLGRLKEAADMLEGVLDYARDPSDRAMTLNNIAYYLGEDGRQLERALALADSSLSIKRAFSTLDTRAWILHKLGREREAYEVMMQVLADRPKYGNGGEVDMTKIVDHRAMYKEIEPVLGLLEVEGDSIEDIDSETLASLIFVLGQQVGIDQGSMPEYLIHLFHICLALGDEYGAWSVGLWLRGMNIDDSEYETEMKRLDDSHGEVQKQLENE